MDFLVIKEGMKITTDLFYKKTDSHQYLIFDSCHPSHTKRNTPFNMARRICTIVVDEERRKTRLSELKIFLTRQRYPIQLIESAIRKATETPIAELRSIKQREESNNTKIPFVLTHNPRNHNMFKSAKQFFPILQQSENLQELIQPNDILHSRWQPPNLKNILTKAKFTSNPVKPTVSTCEDPRCGTCPFLQTGPSIMFKNGMHFNVNSTMNCKSKNLIYCMTCPTCGDNYKG